MNIEDLREFTVLTNCKSFTRAAKKLYMSQSTLSSHILRMEKELDLPLIDRTHEHFALTPIGMEFALCAQDTLSVFDQGIQRCRETERDLPLRMVVKHHIDADARHRLIGLDAGLAFVKSDSTTSWANELRRGVGDVICIPYSPNDIDYLAELDRQGFALKEYQRKRACICVSSKSPLWNAEELHAQDVRNSRVTIFDDGYVDVWEQVVRDLLGLDETIHLRQMPIGSYDNLLLSMRDGSTFVMGVDTVEEYIGAANGALKAFYEMDGKPLEFSLALAYLKDNPRAADIEAFCRQTCDANASS